MHRVVIKYKSSYITKIYVLFIIFTLEYYSTRVCIRATSSYYS